MLVEQTLEKLEAMKLHGMAKALRRWLEQPQDRELMPADQRKELLEVLGISDRLAGIGDRLAPERVSGFAGMRR